MVKAVACFAKGTFISTEKGEVEVQDLRAGDMLVTHDGELVPLRWVGHRHIDITKHQDERLTYLPICIRKDALANNVPSRDLYVSGGHAMLIDGSLVMARRLFNNASVGCADVREVDYYHLECDRHTILIANGAATESYLDRGNKEFFENNDGAISLRPVMPETIAAGALAAPWVDIESLGRIRQALFDRAVAQGFSNVYHPSIKDRRKAQAA